MEIGRVMEPEEQEGEETLSITNLFRHRRECLNRAIDTMVNYELPNGEVRVREVAETASVLMEMQDELASLSFIPEILPAGNALSTSSGQPLYPSDRILVVKCTEREEGIGALLSLKHYNNAPQLAHMMFRSKTCIRIRNWVSH